MEREEGAARKEVVPGVQSPRVPYHPEKARLAVRKELAQKISAVWDRIIEETNDELSTEQMMARTCQEVVAEKILPDCDNCDVAEALWIMEGKP